MRPFNQKLVRIVTGPRGKPGTECVRRFVVPLPCTHVEAIRRVREYCGQDMKLMKFLGRGFGFCCEDGYGTMPAGLLVCDVEGFYEGRDERSK